MKSTNPYHKTFVKLKEHFVGVILYFNVFGIFLQIKSKKNPKTKKYLLTLWCVVGIIICTLLWWHNVKVESNKEFSNRSFKISILGYLSLTYIMNIFLLITFFLSNEKFNEILDDIIEIHVYLETLNIYVDHRHLKMFKKKIIYPILFWKLVCVGLLLTLKDISYGQKVSIALNVITKSTVFYIGSIYLFVISVYYKRLQKSMICIADYKLSSYDANTIIMKELFYKLLSVHRNLSKIVDSLYSLGELSVFIATFLTTINAMVLSACIYFTMKESVDNYIIVMKVLTFVICLICEGFHSLLGAHAFIHVTAKANIFGMYMMAAYRNIHQFDFDVNAENESLYILHRRMEFMILNMFSPNYNSVYSVLIGVATFIMAVIEYDQNIFG